MNPAAVSSDFFAMPWPSDHRRSENGTIDLTGYPAIDGAPWGVGRTIVGAFQPTLTGFGTNSGAFIQFDGPLTAPLPAATATTSANSPIMLVNLNNPSAGRVPLRLDFKADGANGRPANLLAVLPAPGFTLEANSTYALIVFKQLGGASTPLERAPLLDQLTGTTPPDGLNEDQFNALQAHKSMVDQYVTARGRSASDVVAFAVYSTQFVDTEMNAVAATIANMGTVELTYAYADSLVVERSCGRCEANDCLPAVVTGAITMPRFQKPVQLSVDTECLRAGGSDCFTTSGGEIEVVDGRATVQEWKAGEKLRILVPCHAGPPTGGWPTIFMAGGTGGDEMGADYETLVKFEKANVLLNHVVASIVPYQSPGRQDEALVAEVMKFFAQLPGEPPDPMELAGVLYTFPFNPVAARNNQIQSAGDALFIKRMLSVLGTAASSLDWSAHGLRRNSFVTNPQRTLLHGHSQGSGSGVLALTVPYTAGGYRDGYLNSPGAALIYEDLVIRSDTRPVFELIFGLTLDRFHPFGHLMQTAGEVASPMNYAHRVATRHLLITSGYEDACGTRESNSALVTRMYRSGKIAAANVVAQYDAWGEPRPPAIEGLQTILNAPLLTLPARGNLSGGRTSVFMLLPGLHGGSGTSAEAGRFMHAIGAGQTPTISAPPYAGPDDDFACGGLDENGNPLIYRTFD